MHLGHRLEPRVCWQAQLVQNPAQPCHRRKQTHDPCYDERRLNAKSQATWIYARSHEALWRKPARFPCPLDSLHRAYCNMQSAAPADRNLALPGHGYAEPCSGIARQYCFANRRPVTPLLPKPPQSAAIFRHRSTCATNCRSCYSPSQAQLCDSFLVSVSGTVLNKPLTARCANRPA